MTTKELAKYIGMDAEHDNGFYRAAVKIADARVMYGAVQVQVTPLAGRGTAWVRLDSVNLTNIDKKGE